MRNRTKVKFYESTDYKEFIKDYGEGSMLSMELSNRFILLKQQQPEVKIAVEALRKDCLKSK